MKTQTDEEDRQKSGVTSIYQMVLIEVVVVLLLLLAVPPTKKIFRIIFSSSFSFELDVKILNYSNIPSVVINI